MNHSTYNAIVNFIWGIADDVLRDVYVRGKYRDVILPMTVIRRLDAVLEPTKQAVIKMKEQFDKAGIVNLQGLCQASGQAFYNASPFTLRDLKARAKQQQLKADFEAYLDAFSPNVQEILDKFKFRNQIPTLVEADILGHLIEKILDSNINLSPNPVYDSEGNVKLPGLDNHGMGTIFEELIRRFNEENNEEAGEHFTPRDVIKLMANLIFLPIADKIESGTYLVYDGACGTGGMLTVAEDTLTKLAGDHKKEVSIHLYGQEVNPETYAISKADLLLKGEGEGADNMKFGSTLSSDAFPSNEFDFMMSNPPYGKSWKTDLERMGGKSEITDPRFIVRHNGDPEYRMITRSSDGQLMFLVNKLSKMKHNTPLGSRIAEVHNGSSLFTGDAGQGESNIRRWIIENDWLEAIVALPESMFYNTGIATYIWILTNRKAEHRKGKIQLIDATKWFKPLRKNLGQKNCELSEEDVKRICDVFLAFKETEESKIFPNESFGYWKIIIERPLRLRDIDPEKIYPSKEIKKMVEKGHVDENGHPVIRRIYWDDTIEPTPLHGFFERKIRGRKTIVEYEPDTNLRDTEKVPLLEDGGIEAFFKREVLPYVPDAWIDESKTKIGYKVSFTKHFYKPPPLRTLEEIRADIQALEKETEGLLEQIIGEKDKQAIIKKAVTKGINPNVKLKPSGIDWLGDIPEHWKLTRNNQLFELRHEIVGNRYKDFTLLSLTLNGVVERDIESGKGKFPADFSTYQAVYPGDFVFCLFDIDETPRTVGLSNIRGMVTGAYTVFKSIAGNPEYLYYYYLSLDQTKALKPEYAGLRKVIPKDRFLRIKSPQPPLPEQSQIVNKIITEISIIGAAISRAKQEIDLIREYRARLISEVVTGKVDVRDIPVEPIEGIEELEQSDIADEIEEAADSGESIDADQ